MNPTMNLEEAGRYLNISSDVMRDLAYAGTIPGAKVSKGWVFRTKDLDAYLDEVIAKQTDERREARMIGRRAHVKTEVTAVREKTSKRRVPPELPMMPA